MLKIIVLVSCFFQLLGAFLAKKRLARPTFYEKRRRPISIIKPMSGMDRDLDTCVRSFLRLEEFPGDELIFCFQSEHDVSYLFVKEMIEAFPYKKPNTRLMVCPTNIHVNPKINNIHTAVMVAKNDLILISDSNVVAPWNYKQVLDSEFESGTILTSLVGSAYGGLDATMMNTFYSKWILILNFIGMPTVVGKSMMFERILFGRFGGLTRAGRYLAEDYAIGKMFRTRGCEIQISTQPVLQTNYKNGFWTRYMRWGVMRKAHAPAAYILEPLGYGVVTQTLASFAFGWQISLLIGWVWYLCDSYMCRKVSGSKLGFHEYILREWSAVPMWLCGLFTDEVNWRGKKYLLHIGGTSDIVKE